MTNPLSKMLVFELVYCAFIFNKPLNSLIFLTRTTAGSFKGIGKKGNCNVQMARILQYLECPQYLRKSFFPQHEDLKYACKHFAQLFKS